MKSVVLLSGGIDSAVAMALTTASGGDVCALTVDYGQRHRREIRAAFAVANYYGVEHRVIAMDPMLFQGSALTGDTALPAGHADQPDATYVPARNTVLLALAAAYAESRGAGQVVIGANADDAAAYPDCRPSYIEAFRDVLSTGTVGHTWVHAPLLYLTKPEVLTRADELGVPLELTWSCYAGGDQPCGRCGACVGASR